MILFFDEYKMCLRFQKSDIESSDTDVGGNDKEHKKEDEKTTECFISKRKISLVEIFSSKKVDRY
jgi:hypothetical protein